MKLFLSLLVTIFSTTATYASSCDFLNDHSETICSNSATERISLYDYNNSMYNSLSTEIISKNWISMEGDTLFEVEISKTDSFYFVATNSDNCTDTSTLTINISYINAANSTQTIPEDSTGSAFVILNNFNENVSDCEFCSFTWIENIATDTTIILDSIRFNNEKLVYCVVANENCYDTVYIQFYESSAHSDPAWKFTRGYICSNEIIDLKEYITGDLGGAFSYNDKEIVDGIIDNWSAGNYIIRYKIGPNFIDDTITIYSTSIEFENDEFIGCLNDTIDLSSTLGVEKYITSEFFYDSTSHINENNYYFNYEEDTLITVKSYLENQCAQDSFSFNLHLLSSEFTIENDTNYYCISNDTIDLIKDFGFELYEQAIFFSNDSPIIDNRYLDLSALDTNDIVHPNLRVHTGCSSDTINLSLIKIHEVIDAQGGKHSTNNCNADTINIHTDFYINRNYEYSFINNDSMYLNDSLILTEFVSILDSAFEVAVIAKGKCAIDTIISHLTVEDCPIFIDFEENQAKSVYPTLTTGLLEHNFNNGELSIFNMNGHLIHTSIITDNLIDLTNFTNGQYIIKVVQNHRVHTHQVIKIR